MRAGRIDPLQASDASRIATAGTEVELPPGALRLLLDPGRAASRTIADMLSEIVVLGRLSGIQIGSVQATECRTCGLTNSKSAPRLPAHAARNIVELQLIADREKLMGEGQSVLWDQFQGSLRMVIPWEADLTSMFPLGSAAATDQKFRAMSREAVDLATKESAKRARFRGSKMSSSPRKKGRPWFRCRKARVIPDFCSRAERTRARSKAP